MYVAVAFSVLVVVWGATPYAISLQLGPVAPEVLVAYRFGFAGVLLTALSLGLGRWRRLRLRDHLFIALQGVMMFSIVDLMVYPAIERVASGLVQLVISSTIVFNILFGALFLGLPVRPRVVAGGFIGIAGIVMVSWSEVRGIQWTGAGPVGFGLAFAAMLVGSLAAITAARNQRHGLPVLETAAFGMLYGAACSIVVALALGRSFSWDWSAAFLGALAWVTLLSTALGFVLFLTLIGRIGPDRAAYTIVLTPLLALAISTAVEGFAWTALSAAGAVTVLVGNVVALSRLEKAPLAAPGVASGGTGATTGRP